MLYVLLSPTDINAQGYQDQSQQMYYNDDNNYPASGINNKEKWKGEQNYYNNKIQSTVRKLSKK